MLKSYSLRLLIYQILIWINILSYSLRMKVYIYIYIILEILREVIKEVSEWDFNMSLSTKGGLYAAVWETKFRSSLFNSELNTHIKEAVLSSFNFDNFLIYALGEWQQGINLNYQFCKSKDNMPIKDIPLCPILLIGSIVKAYNFVFDKLGNDQVI